MAPVTVRHDGDPTGLDDGGPDRAGTMRIVALIFDVIVLALLALVLWNMGLGDMVATIRQALFG